MFNSPARGQDNSNANTMFCMQRKRRALTPEEADDAERLRAVWFRKNRELGLTQEVAAAECGWTQGAFGHYLRGRVPLNLEAVLKIARVLQISPAEISPRLTNLLYEPQAFPTYMEVRESAPASGYRHAKSKKLAAWMKLGEQFDKEGMLDVAIRSNKPLAAKLRRKDHEKAHSQTVERKKAV